MIDKTKLEKIKEKLVKVYKPLGIYLFGSYAWGKPDINSDIDVAIIVDKTDDKPHKRAVKGLRALRGIGIAKDLIVFTKNEFDQLSKEPSTLQNAIKKNGIILYERI